MGGAEIKFGNSEIQKFGNLERTRRDEEKEKEKDRDRHESELVHWEALVTADTEKKIKDQRSKFKIQTWLFLIRTAYRKTDSSQTRHLLSHH